MKAVYTLWSSPGAAINQGFRTDRELCNTLCLSLLKIKEQPGISGTILVCNSAAKEVVIDKYNLPFDEVKCELDSLDELDPDLWAYAKIVSYSLQDEPFIHIDNDVIIWEQLPDQFLTAPLGFQNREDLSSFVGYNKSLKQVQFAVPKEIQDNPPKFAYNCGVVLANDLLFIKVWKSLVDQFLRNVKLFLDNQPNVSKHDKNHLFEQYFVSALIEATKHHKDIGLLFPNFENEDWRYPSFGYTHLWGEAKRDPGIMSKIVARLKTYAPDIFKQMNFAEQDHQNQFEKVYNDGIWGIGSGGGSTDEATQEYREFLQSFLDENNIKSVLDIGCGYWAFNEHINWSGIEYTGVDVARPVIDHNNQNNKTSTRSFMVGNMLSADLPKADLIIVKDVMIHHPNNDILKFLKREQNAKFALVTNDNHGSINSDIDTPGKYHSIDITKPPFNVNAKPVLVWKGQNKTTHLIEYGSN